ncbi:MAG: arylesterase [Limisphaerales bacterium]
MNKTVISIFNATKAPRRSFLAVLLSCFVALACAATEQPEVKTVMVLGNSIATGYGIEQSLAFPSLLQRKIDENKLPYKVVNAGLSGDTTAGGVRRMPWLLRQQVDVLIVELGGNDGLRGVSPDETRKNLEKIIDLARAKNPNVKVLVAGMQMPQNMGAEYTRKFREIFPEVAAKKNATLIPFLLEGVGGRADMNLPDRIHPNPKGHEIVAQNVWAVLEQVLRADGEKG